MKKQSVKVSMLATPLMIVCGLVASVGFAAAQSETQSNDWHESCSNRTLSGDYGSAGEGVLLPPITPSETQFRSVGMTHFDGKGNFTGVEHTVVNGMPIPPNVDWTENSGTYTVNLNCTGKLVLNTPNGPPGQVLNLFFVIVKHGTEFHTVLDFGGALSATYTKVGLSRR
jgi:hypothetical protein